MSEEAYIYKVSFYKSKRHSLSFSNMYFRTERFTRWAHDCELTKVFIIKVKINSEEYKMACKTDVDMINEEYEKYCGEECEELF